MRKWRGEGEEGAGQGCCPDTHDGMLTFTAASGGRNAFNNKGPSWEVCYGHGQMLLLGLLE